LEQRRIVAEDDGSPYAFLAGAPNDLFAARYAHHALPQLLARSPP
jgi:hypothetical protein